MSALAPSIDPPVSTDQTNSMVDPALNVHRSKLVKGAQIKFLHWLVVFLSILLTIAAWHISKEQVSHRVEERFNREAEQMLDLVKERLTLYENTLWGAVALIDSNYGSITYPQWYDYANSLHIDEVNPGINGIGVIYNIKRHQLQAFLARERQWRPDFRLHPRHGESEYWPITYIEPVGPNHSAVGLDVAFEGNRYNGIKQARDSGQAQITGPVTLVQDLGKTPGFLFFTPFYEQGFKPDSIVERREKILGVTYAPFIMSRFMQGTLASKNRHVSISISDGGELLYRDKMHGNDGGTDIEPLYRVEKSVPVYGREWTFRIASNQSFHLAAANNQPTYILIGGILIDCLILAVFVFLSRANQRALQHADRMTEAMVTKTLDLQKSNDDLQQFAYIASHDLKSPLNAIHKLVNWIEEDLGDDIPQSSKNHLELLRGRSTRMSRLLDDLLSYSRVGSFDYSCEEVNLGSLAAEIFEMLDKPGGFHLEAGDSLLYIQRIPLEIVLRNVISNAIKHHDRDSGVITLSCARNADEYLVRVQDDGPGIPPNLHDKAMEMFQTLQSRDDVEGSGMGLAMVRRIAEHHGGSLEIDSNGERGTTIVIHWPLSKVNA